MSKDKTPEAPVLGAPTDPAELETLAALDTLGAEIAGDEAEFSQAQAATSAAAAKAKAESWAFIPAMFGKIMAMALPELKDVYTEAACLSWGEAMVPVAEKYGWGDPAVSVEVALILATVPLALPTGIAVKKYMDERQSQQGQPRKQSRAQLAQPEPSAAPSEAPAASHILPAGLFAGDLKPSLAPNNKQPA